MVLLRREEIADDIRHRIEDGRLRPGDPVPSARELADQWGCARGTIGEAMDILRDLGLIVGRQGARFYVTDTPVARSAGGRAAGSVRTSGARPFRIVGKPAMRVPPPRIADLLETAPGVQALARTRVHVLDDGSPATVVTAWFPPDIAEVCELLHRADALPGGTTRHVLDRTGRAPVRGEDLKGPRLASESEAMILGLEMPSAVEAVVHRAFDAEDRVLVVEEGVTGAELAQVRIEYPMSI